MATATKEAKEPKQKRLPGTENAEIEELEAAAEHYVEVRDKRMQLTEKETDARDIVATVMARHKLTHYCHNGCEITLVPTDVKVKVRIAKDEE